MNLCFNNMIGHCTFIKCNKCFLLILLGCLVYAYEYYISTRWMMNIGLILTYNNVSEI